MGRLVLDHIWGSFVYNNPEGHFSSGSANAQATVRLRRAAAHIYIPATTKQIRIFASGLQSTELARLPRACLQSTERGALPCRVLARVHMDHMSAVLHCAVNAGSHDHMSAVV